MKQRQPNVNMQSPEACKPSLITNLIARLLENLNAQHQVRQLGPPIPQVSNQVLDDVRPVCKVVHHVAGFDDGQHDQGRRQHVPKREPRAVMPGAEILRLSDVEGARDCLLSIAEHRVVGFLSWLIALGRDVDKGPVKPGFQF